MRWGVFVLGLVFLFVWFGFGVSVRAAAAAAGKILLEVGYGLAHRAEEPLASANRVREAEPWPF